MNPRENGVWQLAVVAACLLLTSLLPSVFADWFVESSGHISVSFLWTTLLSISLFQRWRPAHFITLLFSCVQLYLAYVVLSYNIPHGGKVLGFGLLVPLHLTVVLMLLFSKGINQYFKRGNSVAA
ncbi:hypothetical protein [Hymenobacter sp. AT01-02]|uniref:hypothetical protein n=1 Tax=Hymenobacter sp. AT01-02 TaxID=1571877 RepID=UPI0005F1416D|nr:hypothetical protein [Hymenobacter sp. AT01-02]